MSSPPLFARGPLATPRSVARIGVLTIATCLALGACETSASLTDPAGADSSGNGGGGTVQRATLTVSAVLPGPDDAALGASLGSTGGVLRDATVTIERAGSAASRVTARTDANGTVRFPELLAGSYSVSVLRTLTAEEVARLGTGNEDVIGFGGGITVVVSESAASAIVAVVAGRRGSLVISEIFQYWPRAADGGNYPYGGYVELYNNSDTTVYLDGKYLGEGVRAEFAPRSYPQYTCENTADFRSDAQGIWTRAFWRFPGAGRQHPLAPGRAVVIATDAIDHGEYVAGLPNLQTAAFEFRGSADVDNPGVPEMINVGVASLGSRVTGHGFTWGANAMTFFVADAVDLATLPRRDIYPDVFGNQAEHVRFPVAKVLNAFSGVLAPEVLATLPTAVLCPENTHPGIDRQRAFVMSVEYSGSIQRRVFRTSEGGRVVLQNTRTSAQDYRRVEKETPGSVP